MEKLSYYDISENLTNILIKMQGVTDTLKALHTAMEKDKAIYSDSVFLVQCVAEEQCEQMKVLLEGLS